MKKLLIGTIVNTHGLRGEVKIMPKTHFVKERFAKGSTVFLADKDQCKPLTVTASRMYKNMLIVAFEDVCHIDDIERWKGYDIYADAEALAELPEDEIYYHELYDCAVYDEDGNCLGTVVEVIETGAHAVLRIKKEEMSFLLPYVKTFVTRVEKEKKKLTVALVEGIL